MMNEWRIAVLCSVIRFFLSGIRRIGALLFIECLIRFRVTRKVASIPFITAFLLISLTGPLVGYLGGRFQLRSVITVGCILSAFGVGANFWAEDIITVTIIWGILFGAGISIGSSLLPEVLNRHFDRNVSTANGITYAGSSVGAAVFPFIAQFLINAYGVSGAFLILGGLTLNTLPAGLLLGKDPKTNNLIAHAYNGNTTSVENETSNSNAYANFSPFVGVPQNDDVVCKRIENFDVNSLQVSQYIKIDEIDESRSIAVDSSSLQATPLISESALSELQNRTSTYVDDHRHDIHIISQNEKTKYDDISSTNRGNILDITQDALSQVDARRSHTNGTLSDSHEGEHIASSACHAFRIFQTPAFIAILITQSLFIGILAIINTVIIDYCMDKSVTANEGVYILIGLAVADVAGRLCLGWISDFGFMTVVTFVMYCFVGLGLDLLFFVWSDSFLMCMLSSVIFGLVSGGIMSHSPAIIKQCIRRDQRTMAVTSRYLLFAPLILTMPSFIGYFRDHIGSYDGLIYTLAVVSLTSGAMTYCIPFLTKRKNNMEQNIA